jgi:hypothetical protein
VDVWRETDFGDQREARSRYRGDVRLFEKQLEMRSFHDLRDLLAEFREKFGDHAVAGEALAIFGLEKLLADDAAGIDKEISRAREAFLHAGGFGVADAVRPDGFRIWIREQGVGNVVAVGKIFQDLFRVIADGDQLDALFFKPRHGTLQLDQLPFAEGSPIGGTEEEEDRAFRTLQGVESLRVAGLIAEREGRSFLTDRETDGHQLEGGKLDGVIIERALDGDGVAEMRGDRGLRREAVHDAVGVVVEGELCARDILVAFGRLVESFVGIAAARNEDARPGAVVGRVRLCCAGKR